MSNRYYVSMPDADDEGPYGPYPFMHASQFARIGSQHGDPREVWRGRPHRRGSHLHRRYIHGDTALRANRLNRYTPPTRATGRIGDVYHAGWIAGLSGDPADMPLWVSRTIETSLQARYAFEEGWADGVHSATEAREPESHFGAVRANPVWWSPAQQHWAEARLNRGSNYGNHRPPLPGGPLDESVALAVRDRALDRSAARRLQATYESFNHHAPRRGLVEVPTPKRIPTLHALGGQGVVEYLSAKHIEPGDAERDRTNFYIHCVVPHDKGDGTCRYCKFTAAQGEHEGGGELATVFGPPIKGVRANGQLRLRRWPREAAHLGDAKALGIVTDRGVVRVRFNPPAMMLQAPGEEALIYLPRKRNGQIYIATGGDMRITPDGIAG